VIKGDGDLPPGLLEVKSHLERLGECDEEVVEALEAERGDHGRDDYPASATWRLVAIAPFLRQGRFSDVLGELGRNADLARVIGLGAAFSQHPSTRDVTSIEVMLYDNHGSAAQMSSLTCLWTRRPR
jgi:hypothetical protein